MSPAPRRDAASPTPGGRVRALARRAASRMEPAVFLPAAGLVVAFVAFGTGFTETARTLFESLQAAIVRTLGWLYVLAATGLLGFSLWLGFGRCGKLRLGGPRSEPEFGRVTWFTMLMSAGMGIGVVFFGAAEPLSHALEPPFETTGNDDAVRQALRLTFFHWGLHAWGIYAALALPLAYFHFRHDLPLAPRSLLWPLLGPRIHGPIGHAVDVLCTVGTLFGVATSLGLGAAQINAGLHALAGVPQGTGVQISLVAGITLLATVSVVTGIHRGIRTLSLLNMGLAGLILLFVLVAGPTLYVVEAFVTGLGGYLQHLPETSLWVEPGSDGGWQSRWTLFYWSWWISWSPFVGVFAARISRGRTFREFVLAALCVPTLAGFAWFSVVGGTALHALGEGAAWVQQAADQPPLSLFLVLGSLPWSGLMQVLATLLVMVFFVTSSDSGSLVDDMVTSGGHPDPPRIQRVFWAVAEGAVASTLLMAGGLQALRTGALTTGLPLSIFLIAAAVGLVRALRVELQTSGIPTPERLRRG